MIWLYIAQFLSVALACIENGKKYEHGDEWIDMDVFKVRCNFTSKRNWRVSVIGCILPNGTLMPLGGEESIGGQIWDCKKLENGTIYFGARPKSACDGRQYGFVWQEEWLQYRCGEGGVKEFLGCITETGIFIRNGDMKLVDGAYIQCKKYENGSVVLQGVGRRSNTKCKDSEGRERVEGSEWKEGSLQFRCGKGGVKNFMGCITTSGRFIPYGEMNLVNGKHIKCEKLADGTIKMNVVSRSKCYAKCRDNEGRGVTEGFKWRVGSLQLRCGQNGVELMGCVTSYGIFIPSGEVKSVDGYNVKCERSMDGLATMKIVGRSTCIRSGFK